MATTLTTTYTAKDGKTYSGHRANIKRWQDLEDDYRWGIYDLGDLEQDTAKGTVTIRPDIHSTHLDAAPWNGDRARYAADILTDLGFYAKPRYRDGIGWTIQVTRYGLTHVAGF